MLPKDLIYIPVGVASISGRDIVRWLADRAEPIRLRRLSKITLIDGVRHSEKLTLADYELLAHFFREDINILVDDISQKKLQKLKQLGISKGQYRTLCWPHPIGGELVMYRGTPCTKNDLHKILQLSFDVTPEQLEFIALLHEMKKKQWPHFQRRFDNALNKPEWVLKAHFSDEDKVWQRRRFMIEESKLSEMNVSFVHGELPGVLNKDKVSAGRVEYDSIIPIEVASNYMARNGFLLQENATTQNMEFSSEVGVVDGLQKAQKIETPQLKEDFQLMPWIENSKKIFEELRKGREVVSLEKMADKVHEEMKRRHKKGEKGMTKRGGKECPSAASILRRGF